MEISIICSKRDTAGMTIHNILAKEYFKDICGEYKGNEIRSFENAKLYLIEEDPVYPENIDKDIGSDLLIFATKHQSQTGRPVLSFHAPGNWNKADYGGKQKTVCIAPARYLKEACIRLESYTKGTDIEISCEQTHHGPYVETPVMFIEIGSTEEQWKDNNLGKIICSAIIDLIRLDDSRHNGKSCVFFGGIHYNIGANKVMLRSDYLVGHICSKYFLEDIDKDTVNQAFEKTDPKAEFAVLDWKGMGPGKANILKILEELGIEIMRLKDVC